MPRKIKFIIFGLFALFCITVFISLKILNSKLTVERERDNLKKDNETLSRKVNEGLETNKRLEDKIGALNQDLDTFTKDKEELQRKYDLLKEEREGLVKKLKEVSEAAKKVEPAKFGEAAAPKTEDVFWANLLKTKADLELQLENLRKDLNTANINSDQLEREKSGLEIEVSNLTRENQDLKRQIDYNQKMLDSVTKELVTEKNDKFGMQTNSQTLKSDNSLLRQQLKSLIGSKANLERKLAELQTKYKNLEDNLSKMETLLKDKMLQMDSLSKNLEQLGSAEAVTQGGRKEAVELPPIVVRSQKEGVVSGTQSSLAEGKVLLVNRENNFVIINLGEEAQVRVGETLQVVRNEELVADIEVVETRRAISACDIKREMIPIKVGDLVK